MASSGEFRSCRSGRSQIPPSPTLLPRVSLTGAHGQKADAASPFVCTGFTSGRDFMDRDGLGMTRSALRTLYRDWHLALSPAFRLRASEWSPARRPSPRSAGPHCRLGSQTANCAGRGPAGTRASEIEGGSAAGWSSAGLGRARPRAGESPSLPSTTASGLPDECATVADSGRDRPRPRPAPRHGGRQCRPGTRGCGRWGVILIFGARGRAHIAEKRRKHGGRTGGIEGESKSRRSRGGPLPPTLCRAACQ